MMPPLECKGTKTQRNLCQKPSIKRKNFIFHRKSWSIQKMMYLCTAIRDLAQLVAHYVRDVGVGRSSRLIPTASKKGCPKAAFLAYVCLPLEAAQNPSFLFSKDKLAGLGMIKVAFLLRGRPLLFYFPDIFLFTCAWSGCLLAFHLFAFPMISLGCVGIASL